MFTCGWKDYLIKLDSYPFCIEFCLDARYPADAFQQCVIDVHQNHLNVLEIRLDYDLVLLQGQSQDEAWMLMSSYWTLQGEEVQFSELFNADN